MTNLTTIAALPGSGGGYMTSRAPERFACSVQCDPTRWEPQAGGYPVEPVVDVHRETVGGVPRSNFAQLCAERWGPADKITEVPASPEAAAAPFKLPDLRGHFIRSMDNDAVRAAFERAYPASRLGGVSDDMKRRMLSAFVSAFDEAPYTGGQYKTHDVTDPGQCHPPGLGDPSHNHDYSGAPPTSHRLAFRPLASEAWGYDVNRDCWRRGGKVRFRGDALVAGLWVECDEAHFGLMFDLSALTF